MFLNGRKNIPIKVSHSAVFLGRVKFAMKLRSIILYSEQIWLSFFFFNLFTACGGVLRGEGFFRSPFYPNAYPGRRTCRWTISQPQRQVVLLNFTDFQIGSASCDTDYIEVGVKHHCIIDKGSKYLCVKRNIVCTGQYLINIDIKFPSRIQLNRI